MTTYSDPADALQVGVFELLDGDATLGALVTGVFDDVPEATARPYVSIGEMTSTEDSAHGAPGRETAALIHTWTDAQSFRPGNQIAARVVALLARQHAALDALVDGHVVWMIEHEFGQTLNDPDPTVRHRVDRFRIWTRQEA